MWMGHNRGPEKGNIYVGDSYHLNAGHLANWCLTLSPKNDLQMQRELFIARMLVVDQTTLLLLLKPPALQCPIKL
jgi:hypothetical protein